MAKFSLFSEVLEKNLEASFYFSVLQKKKNNGKGVLLFSVKL